MVLLSKSVKASPGPEFNTALSRELESLAVDQLPLQQGLRTGNQVLEDARTVMVLSVVDEGDLIHARAGVMYHGIIAGCSCADDPTPVEAVNEYCEILVTLDKETGMADIHPVGA